MIKLQLFFWKEQWASKQAGHSHSFISADLSRQERNYTTIIGIFKLLADNEAGLEILFFSKQCLIILG